MYYSVQRHCALVYCGLTIGTDSSTEEATNPKQDRQRETRVYCDKGQSVDETET